MEKTTTKQRVEDEKLQLEVEIRKLKLFLISNPEEKIGLKQFNLIKLQLCYMTPYLEILKLRLKEWYQN